MNRLESITQTYTQAPWRKQMQLVGLLSLVLVVAALVAGVYLNVSAQAAAVGRDIQSMQAHIEVLDREIEDLQSELALVSSADEMESRALASGFSPAQVDQVVYLAIPGYVERQPVMMAPYSGRSVTGAPVLPGTYTESLFDWLKRQLKELSLPTLKVAQ